MQDCVGKFVEFNIDLAAAESRVGGVISRDLSFNGDVWRVQCYPRGAAGDDGAGEYLSVHLVNKSTARSGRILFEAMVLGRGAGGAEAAAASVHSVFQRTLDYPKDTARLPLTRIFRTRELAELYAVHGYVTIVCGVVVLRHSPIPVPPSTLLHDLRGLEVQNRYGTPDVTIAVVDGKSVDVNRSVLSARSPVLKTILDDAAAGSNNKHVAVVEAKPDPSDSGPMEEDSKPPAITVDGEKEEAAVMTDCECCGAPVTTELLRDLLAAADRYRLHRLKLMCAKKLWEDVSVETVSKTLWYAHQYNCRELKNACMNFIAVAGNSYRVMLTNEWHWLGQESPGIINEFKQRATTKYI
ncbi:hypothetical protein PR202_ga20874 [Eleusine coracana subsp. coracana]|uniref:BTB domain-containing protein n=1 Tax=Eleusine coracana subsp. coracana TaxID=191504 RepID=A0AAV5CYG5_ELECO|nr:hypothetical protein PR202_ga20874 [Eleusine coracana subsp. coracana]